MSGDRREYWTALALSIVAGGSLASAAPPVAGPKSVDYERAFAQAFPVSGSEHWIADWAFYAALVSGDLLTYAEKLDPAVGRRADGAKGKPYQLQQLEMSVKRDARLLAAFDDQRRRIQAMVVYVDGGGFANDKCRHPLTYVENEFRLVLGESGDGADPLSHATIAPSCPSALVPGFQITAGRSSRFKCWRTESVTRCGWALPDMPTALKGVVETDYPASMVLRWRWRGLGNVVHTRYVDGNGNRVPIKARVAVSIPNELSLEFVDPAGHILWTAPATVAVLNRANPRGAKTKVLVGKHHVRSGGARTDHVSREQYAPVAVELQLGFSSACGGLAVRSRRSKDHGQLVSLQRLVLEERDHQAIQLLPTLRQHRRRLVQRAGQHQAGLLLNHGDGRRAGPALGADALAQKRVLRLMLVEDRAEALAHSVVSHHVMARRVASLRSFRRRSRCSSRPGARRRSRP